MNVCCVFSLESPYQGNSNEYTQHTIFNIKKLITQIILNLQLRDFSKGFKNEFEIAVVKEPSVFEPLKFYSIMSHYWQLPSENSFETNDISPQNTIVFSDVPLSKAPLKSKTMKSKLLLYMLSKVILLAN